MTDTIRRAWQASAAEAKLPTIEEIRMNADRFHRIVRRRNLIEYAAGALVIAFFGAGIFFMHPFAARVGAALTVLGTCFMLWQLHYRASAIAPPDAVGAQPILQHQRAQLTRQRDALARVGLWYLAPLVPGLLVMQLAPLFHDGTMPARALVSVAISALVFAGVWWLNRLGARRLQRAIDEIDALAG